MAGQAASKAPPLPATTESGRVQAPHVRAFQEKLHEHAHAAEQTTGVPAKFMLGQAALETGWGKRMIKNADGTSSNNLFGIKAGPGWKGKVALATTTEYVNGKPQTRVEKFRAYDTPADSFRDYARLITNNPRYEKVIANGGDAESFARGLQRAGYATDPNYAAKLTRLIKHSLA
jgi:flagellar protein FlgJ